MAIHVYRYKLSDPSLGRLASEVPGSPVVGSLAPSVFVDITLDDLFKPDLDEVMLLRGYAFDSTDPVTTPLQQSGANNVHASAHASGGGDPLTLAESQITGLVSDLASKVPTSRQVGTTNGLQGGGDLSADRTLSPVYGSGANTVCQGNDSRLSDARTPTGPASGDLQGTYPSPAILDSRKPDLGIVRSVRVASTVNIVSLSGLLTIDGVTVVAGDKVLVKNQTTASENGVYVAAAGAWSFCPNCWAQGAVVSQISVHVSEGTTQARTVWRLTTTGTITVGTTSLTFVEYRFWPWIRSKTLTVDSDPNSLADYTTIQAAIDAASSGTTILIAPGRYQEALILKDGVHLQGMASNSLINAFSPNTSVDAQPFAVVYFTGTTTRTLLSYSGTATAPIYVSNIYFVLNPSGAASSETFKFIDTTGSTIGNRLSFRNCAFRISYSSNPATGPSASYIFQTATGEAQPWFDSCVFSGLDVFNKLVWLNSAAITNRTTINFVDSSVGSPASATYSMQMQDGASSTLTSCPTFGSINRVTTNTSLTIINCGSIQSITNDADDSAGYPTNALRLVHGAMLTDGTKQAYKVPLRSIAGDVATPANGDLWYNATTNKFRARQNGVSLDVVSGGGSAPGGADRAVQFNNAGLFDGAAKLEVSSEGFAVLREPTFATGNPVAPTEGALLFSRKRASRRLASVVDPHAEIHTLQPDFFSRKIGMWSAQGNGATVSTWAFGNTTTGTATTANVAANSTSQLRRIDYVSSTTAGSSAGTRHNALQFYRGNASFLGGFFYVARFIITTKVANTRLFVGLHSSAAVIGNVNPSTLTNMCGFGIDSAQANMRFFHNDGAGVATSVDTGIAATQGIPFEVRIYCGSFGSVIGFSIENFISGGATIFEGEASTDLPVNTQLLSPQMWINNGTTGAATTIGCISQYIETPDNNDTP